MELKEFPQFLDKKMQKWKTVNIDLQSTFLPENLQYIRIIIVYWYFLLRQFSESSIDSQLGVYLLFYKYYKFPNQVSVCPILCDLLSYNYFTFFNRYQHSLWVGVPRLYYLLRTVTDVSVYSTYIYVVGINYDLASFSYFSLSW